MSQAKALLYPLSIVVGQHWRTLCVASTCFNCTMGKRWKPMVYSHPAPWGFQPLVNGFNGLMYDTFSSYGYVADTAPFGARFWTPLICCSALRQHRCSHRHLLPETWLESGKKWGTKSWGSMRTAGYNMGIPWYTGGYPSRRIEPS